MAYIVHDDVFRICGLPTDGSVITEADVDSFIAEAESYVQQMLGTFYDSDGTGTQITDVYDGTGTDTLFLRQYPIISLDAVTIDSTSVTPSLIHQYTDTGKLILKTTAQVTTWTTNNPRNISIQYTYGEQADNRVKHYTALVAGMMTLIAQIGGTFDDVTSFQLPEISGSLGEPYTNIREALQRIIKMEEHFRQFVRIKPQFG